MILSEIFGPVLQGEGASLGVPSFFMRFGGCNLYCGFGKAKDFTWTCDSEAIWKRGKEWTNEQVLAFIEKTGELPRVLEGSTHIIFTGGEPTLPAHRISIIEFISFLDKKFPDNTAFFEIETNGAVPNIEDSFFGYMDQINCSPKLANAGMPESLRIVPHTLAQIYSHENSWFKFVITKEGDWDEIVQTYLPHMSRKKIMLMPGGMDIEELEVTGKVVWEIACRENLRATTRLQIFTWRKRTGV